MLSLTITITVVYTYVSAYRWILTQEREEKLYFYDWIEFCELFLCSSFPDFLCVRSLTWRIPSHESRVQSRVRMYYPLYWNNNIIFDSRCSRGIEFYLLNFFFEFVALWFRSSYRHGIRSSNTRVMFMYIYIYISKKTRSSLKIKQYNKHSVRGDRKSRHSVLSQYIIILWSQPLIYCGCTMYGFCSDNNNNDSKRL